MGDNHRQTKLTDAAVYRILDANLDRAREGLRIIEEWCRFGLNSTTLTEECKQLRQAIAQWHTEDIRLARDTPNDAGTDLSHPNEEHRASIAQLLRVNLARVQEALRVLEEYGKIIDPEMGAACKQLRYRTYTLDSKLFGQQRQQKLWRSRLYLVTSPHDNLFGIVEGALQGGLDIVQYRDKDADDRNRLVRAEKLKQLCQRYNALFIVNDRVDVALAVDADGVHLGQQDVSIAFARQLLGTDKIVGRSTTNPDELQKAIEDGADYIGVGPVYETPTKPGKAAAGFDYLRHAAEHAKIPWFAIGGINVDNLADVLSNQVDRVAIVRAIMEADNPTLVTQYFVSQLARIQTLRTVHSHPV